MNRQELIALGQKLAVKFTDPEILIFIAGVLPVIDGTHCPRCAARRKQKAAAMRKYRKSSKKDDLGDFA